MLNFRGFSLCIELTKELLFEAFHTVLFKMIQAEQECNVDITTTMEAKFIKKYIKMRKNRI